MAEEEAPLPVSAVMMSVAKHVAVRCRAENKAFMDCKNEDRNPSHCLQQGQEITKCVIHLMQELNEKCPKQLKAFHECMDYYRSCALSRRTMAYDFAAAKNSTSHGARQQADWSPYDNNGGTCVAVAGADYCIVAIASRLSTGFTILCRDAPFVTKMSFRPLLSKADIKTVHKLLQARSVMYQHQHKKPMSCPAMAQLMSNTLYYRRFFPYYTFTICAGLDPDGKGCVFSYDAIGNVSKVDQSCHGTGESLIQPVLDAQLKSTNALLVPPADDTVHLNVEDAVDVVKDAFTTAGERDIYTGDVVEIYIMTRDGVKTDRLELKKD